MAARKWLHANFSCCLKQANGLVCCFALKYGPDVATFFSLSHGLFKC